MVDSDLSEQQTILEDLFQSNQVLSLATLGAESLPEASLTPYLYYQEAFWVFVSRLSAHTENLLSRPNISFLIFDSQPVNPFSAVRCSIHAKAEEVFAEKEDEGKENVLDLMAEKLGDTVSLLRQLNDFHLIRLKPQAGTFIMGFGQAFDVEFPTLTLTHVNPNK